MQYLKSTYLAIILNKAEMQQPTALAHFTPPYLRSPLIAIISIPHHTILHWITPIHTKHCHSTP